MRAALKSTEKSAPEPSAQPSGATGTELSPLSRTQRVVGERMQQAWQAPHHYATVEVHVDELLALRGRLNEALAEGTADGSRDDSGADGPVRLSINDFVMKACALVQLDTVGGPPGVELGERTQRQRARLHHEVVDRQLDRAAP